MSETQIGSQENRPVDTAKIEANINAAIDISVKHSMSSLSKFMDMVSGAGGGGMDFVGEAIGAKTSGITTAVQAHEEASHKTTADSLASMGGRKKGSQTLAQMLSTTDGLGHKRTREEIIQRRAVVDAAWVGKDKGSKYSESTGAEWIGQLNAIKKQYSSFAANLKRNPQNLAAAGFGQLKNDYDAVQVEKVNPAANAIISGTLNDMDRYKDGFKSIDEGVKEKLASNGGAEVEKKLKPLMAKPEKPKAETTTATTETKAEDKKPEEQKVEAQQPAPVQAKPKVAAMQPPKPAFMTAPKPPSNYGRKSDEDKG